MKVVFCQKRFELVRNDVAAFGDVRFDAFSVVLAGHLPGRIHVPEVGHGLTHESGQVSGQEWGQPRQLKPLMPFAFCRLGCAGESAEKYVVCFPTPPPKRLKNWGWGRETNLSWN